MDTSRATHLARKNADPELSIGAFTFTRDSTGRLVLHVDAQSGLYPIRLTLEQEHALAHLLLLKQEEDMSHE